MADRRKRIRSDAAAMSGNQFAVGSSRFLRPEWPQVEIPAIQASSSLARRFVEQVRRNKSFSPWHSACRWKSGSNYHFSQTFGAALPTICRCRKSRLGLIVHSVGVTGPQTTPENAGETACFKLGNAESNAVDQELADLLAIWPRLSVPDREQVVNIARLVADAAEARRST